MADEPTQRASTRVARLLDSGDPDAATAILEPLTRHPDPDVAGEAWLLIGTARYRTRRRAGRPRRPGGGRAEPAAAAPGSAGAASPSSTSATATSRAPIAAYREADRRAPPAERGAIANRIAWLLKETGHDFAARRQFNRARGAYATHTPFVTYAIIAICVGALRRRRDPERGRDARRRPLRGGVGPIGESNLINASAVAAGRVVARSSRAPSSTSAPSTSPSTCTCCTCTAPIVERMYGHVEYALIYLLCAAGGSVLTILVDPAQSAAGASGAIFGLVGLLFVVSRRHHAVLGREARMMVAGIGGFSCTSSCSRSSSRASAGPAISAG